MSQLKCYEGVNADLIDKMIKVKNVLKNKILLFEDKQIVFSLLEGKQNFKFRRV